MAPGWRAGWPRRTGGAEPCGRVAVGVRDIYANCERLNASGGLSTSKPGPMKHGSTVIAFVKDPDGYAIELIQISA